MTSVLNVDYCITQWNLISNTLLFKYRIALIILRASQPRNDETVQVLL